MSGRGPQEAVDLLSRVIAFRDERVLPQEAAFDRQVGEGATRWMPVPVLEELRAEARKAGLWNLGLSADVGGPGLSQVQYAPLCEAMGWNEWLPEVFNCNPPDSGNISLLAGFAAPEQKDAWLQPLIEGEIRSCFAMTEPGVASSDAGNISMCAEAVGDEWVLNGEKWWISGPGNPLCRLAIVVALTDPDGPRGQRHSVFLLPMDTPGLRVVRPLSVFGIDFAPRGFCHLAFDNVRIPAASLVGERGRGFEIAQGRLGGGRLHHAMRCVGAAERGLRLMCERSVSRVAFGKPLAELGATADLIAQSRIDINLVRALVLETARVFDEQGPPAARSLVSQVKVAAPDMACRVIDRAIQIHGAAGLSPADTPLAALYARLRTLRIADGPDAVHLRVIARSELREHRHGA